MTLAPQPPFAELNRTERDYPLDQCLQHLFEAQAARTPQAVAVVFEDLELTYEELELRANQIARRLQQLGVGPNRFVAICVERSLEMVVGLLGILKAGGTYVPVDPDYPAERIEFMLADAAAPVLLTQSHLAARLPKAGAATVLYLDTDITEGTSTRPPCAAGPDDLAYMIYTSGSTGKPKGAMNAHRGIVNRLLWMQDEYRLDATDTVLQKTPFSFDVSVWEFFWPLMAGARLVLAKPGGHRDSAYLADLITRRNVTVLHFVPSMLASFLAEPRARQCRSLRDVVCSGEALPFELQQRFFACLPACLHNLYGPTEAAVDVTYWACVRDGNTRTVPIGRPVANTQCYIVDAELQPVPFGQAGELLLGGVQVGRGYHKRPELTAEKFIADPYRPGGRLYRTGDLARYLPDGAIDYLGRIDNQVKIRGMRIELGEIEAALAGHPAVRQVAVLAREDTPAVKRLVAYIVAEPGLSVPELRALALRTLPDYMVPTAFVRLDRLPVTDNGKLDRRALPAPERARPEIATPFAAPTDEAETLIAAVFARVLLLDRVGRDDNFFEIGGDSLLAVEVIEQIGRESACPLPVATIFSRPTPAGLAAAQRAATGTPPEFTVPAAVPRSAGVASEPIAIIGMAVRLPGSPDIEQFWDNLLRGRDVVTRLRTEDLDPAVPAALRDHPNYVRARGLIDGVEMFDPGFFGMSASEAQITDPQQRMLLELSWECLEDAGHAPGAEMRPIGVFAGTYSSTYLSKHILSRPDLAERFGDFYTMLATDKDFVANRVAYKLGLSGPAISIQTACSTSLVAVAQAFDSLRARRCYMALAGAAAVTFPPRSGYLYQDGAMLSVDGTTRTFDAEATGTVFSDGGAVVLLKRLSDALADGDTIHALIRGVAVNNDGGGKSSFMAPSMEGQAAAIEAALCDADVDARSISYVEAHGTATPLGDPVEVEGLTRAFRRWTDDKGFCRIGSVKSNIGHVVAAAGAAGLVKTVLSLRHETLPATLHYRAPNPQIDFAATPFTVNATRQSWPRTATPRRAGVSSFGAGGTNAHVIVEEAPAREPTPPARGPQLLRLSARSAAALEWLAADLAHQLEETPNLNLADVAYTLRVGRRSFAHRLTICAEQPADAVAALRRQDDPLRAQRALAERAPALVFFLPGAAAAYPGMGAALYALEPHFQSAFDDCLAAFAGVLDFDLKQRIFPGTIEDLRVPPTALAATFCVEYALARLWLARGLRPVALIGESVGEFVAAALAGILPLAAAARLLVQACASAGASSTPIARPELVPRPTEPHDIAPAPATIPAISAWTGEHLGAAEAADPNAWAQRLHQSARVLPVLQQLADAGAWALLQVGPVSNSAESAKVALSQAKAPIAVVPALADTPLRERAADLHACGVLWTLGIDVHGEDPGMPSGTRRRLSLPTYPFERRRCWVDAAPAAAPAPAAVTRILL
jgi:amino acid adenylation domain-containing protein